MDTGILYICPTPIGNLEDITLRTLRVLEEVDLIAAEDTRRTLQLLNHFEIKNPLTSYHEHNIREKGPELIKMLEDGKSIALVSDAGMPGISDPGEDIINLCVGEGLEVVVLPGPTASITALVGSGLTTDKFVFEGFLPSKKSDRKKRLEEIKNEYRTMIIYESPYRVVNTLEDILEVMGNRKIAISRELTKKYEEHIRGRVQDGIDRFKDTNIKGEFVLILEGINIEDLEVEEIDIREKLIECINDGMSKSKSVKFISKEYGIPKNEVYKESLEI